MAPEQPRFSVFFDAECPLCRREIEWIRKRDRKRQLNFVDIATPDFDPAKWGKSYRELMQEIHGLSPDGRWVVGVEVFREMYSAAGLRWLVAPTRLPVIRQFLDLGYRWFARHRLRFTGRCAAEMCESKR